MPNAERRPRDRRKSLLFNRPSVDKAATVGAVLDAPERRVNVLDRDGFKFRYREVLTLGFVSDCLVAGVAWDVEGLRPTARGLPANARRQRAAPLEQDALEQIHVNRHDDDQTKRIGADPLDKRIDDTFVSHPPSSGLAAESPVLQCGPPCPP